MTFSPSFRCPFCCDQVSLSKYTVREGLISSEFATKNTSKDQDISIALARFPESFPQGLVIDKDMLAQAEGQT